nr:hypothetical protein BaRGS_005397 [Batillaria attramentaria]
MYAILMACTFVNDMPNPPLGVVILSDSKSSLQALERGGTRNRSDVQSEILFLAHQIITKGTILALMWLPSHSGIRGNELADRAARDATGDGMEAKLLQTLSEVKTSSRLNYCDRHYRSEVLDFWPSDDIDTVRLGFYRNGNEVAFAEFNGTGSTARNWMSRARLLSSSWATLKTQGGNVFSIEGLTNDHAAWNNPAEVETADVLAVTVRFRSSPVFRPSA